MRVKRHYPLFGAIFSGVLSAFALPPLGWSWVLFFALAPLMGLWSQRVAPAWMGFWWGIAFFGMGNFYALPTFAQRADSEWIAGTAWLVALVWLSGSIALVGWLQSWLRVQGFLWAVGVASIWVFIGWLRTLGAFGVPWGFLAVGWARLPLMLQPADLGGVWLVEWITVFWNALLATCGQVSLRRWGFGLVGLGLLWVGYGWVAVRHYEKMERPLKVAVAQPGVWGQGSYRDTRYFESISELVKQAQSSQAKYLIFPESFSPVTLHPHEPEHLEGWKRLSCESSLALVFGAPYYRGDTNTTYNSAVCVLPSGRIEIYHKVQLMPFVENVPLAMVHFLSKLGVGRSSLEQGGVFCTLGTDSPLGALICVESLYGWVARGQVRAGAEWLAVLANDRWLVHPVTRQQFADWCVVRAIEVRRWVVRSSGSSGSGFYAPTGTVKPLPNGVLGIETNSITPLRTQTLYTRWGNWWVYLCGAVFGMIGLVSLLSAKRPLIVATQRSSSKR